jgi:CAAX protease family protein
MGHMATNEGGGGPPANDGGGSEGGGGSGRPASPPASWRAVEVVPVFLLAFLVTGIGFAILQGVVRSCGPQLTVGTLIQELALAGAVLFWIRYVKHSSLASLGLPTRPTGDVVTGVVAGVALFLLAFLVADVTSAVAAAILGHQPVQPKQIDPCIRGLAFQLTGPIVILAAPLGEELFFRGFFYKGLRRRFAVWPSAVISGLAFGALHIAGWSFLLIVPALFLVGVGLALVYEHRQSLLASMAAHATFNVIGFIAIAMGRK